MKNTIEINANWIGRPEDFYITADIEYYNKYDELSKIVDSLRIKM